MNVFLETAAIIVLLVFVLAGDIFGQTQQSAQVILNDILVNRETAPLNIYPSGFLSELQAMGTNLYPPTTISAATTASKVKVAYQPAGGGMTPDGQQADPPMYVAVDLGAPGGGYGQAYGINDNGQVIVVVDNYDPLSEHSFLCSDGSVQNLDTNINDLCSFYGINNNGQMAGEISSSGNPSMLRAVLYSDGLIQNLDTNNNDISFALGINSNGQVAMTIESNTYTSSRAFLYSGGVVHNLGTLGGDSSSASAINNNADVVGDSTTSSGEDHAFLSSGGVIHDLGTLGGSSSQACSVNDSQQVVGWAYKADDFDQQPFLYSGGTMQYLGSLGTDYAGGIAYGVNNGGQVVGYSFLTNGDSHAFVWLQGQMYDLNNLLVNTNWGLILEQATAINASGQIVGFAGDQSGQTHAFLLDPVDPNDLPTIQTGKLHPAYGNGITQQTNKDSLIVITHGAIPFGDVPDTDTAWVDQMSNSISAYLTSNNITNWQVEGHKWTNGAELNYFNIVFSPQFQIPGMPNVLANAKMEGINLGNAILASGNWTNFHFIAHSAGAEVIQACSEVIRAKLGNACTIQCTFLDPYTGFAPSWNLGLLDNPLLNNISIYGNQANWADDYFTKDQQTGGSEWPSTQGSLNHAYAVDVTYLDTNKTLLNGYVQVSGVVSEPCQETESTHYWPIDFYMNTITGATNSQYDGFGFPLSEEGGNWDSIGFYQTGNSPLVLGTPDPDCVSLFQNNTGTAPSNPMNFSAQGQSPLQVEEGLIQNNGTGLNMTGDGPAWLATFINVTNPINYVAFDAQFTTVPQGAGELSVYWDTNAVGFADESLVTSNLEHYVFSFPPAAANSVHMLGFRVDAATNGSSSTVSITNVVTGYIGVSQPFTLAVTTNTYDGLPVFQLTGDSGFNYKVQASTDLVNWVDIAVLVNSNGVVPFVDPESTNYSQRFYRAVAPY